MTAQKGAAFLLKIGSGAAPVTYEAVAGLRTTQMSVNGDTVARGERCASTSNRNFEGRQGHGGRTHLVSPALAAAAAVAGHFIDPADLEDKS